MTEHILARRERWLAFAVLCLGDIMIVLDTTIVNVALPTIKSSLEFDDTGLVWVVNAYLLTFGGFLLLGGRLADLFGQRLLFLIGIVVFTAAAAACGLAFSQEMLIVARAVQGVGGAVVSAVALSLIMSLFPDGPERVRAMGYFGFVMAGGGSVGVLLGGLLTGLFDWRSIFLVNLPIGGLVLFLSLRLLPAGKSEGSRHLDVAGSVTITASLLLAVYAVVNGEQAGWTSGQTLGLIGGAVALLLIFLAIEGSVEEPLVPLGLFKLRNISVSNIIGVLWAAAMFGWFFLSALYMQLVLGYDPLQVGLAFLPANLIMGAFSYSLSAKLVNSFGIRRPLAVGLACAAAGLALFAQAPAAAGSFVLHVLPAMLLLGVGAGMAFNPVLLAAMSDVGPKDSGLASGIVNTAFMMGGSLGLAVLASLATARTNHWLAQGAGTPEALTAGYSLSFLVGAVCAAVAAGLGLLLRERPHGAGEPAPAMTH
jgi:EmrB/QacA subfamily drug resistance transporter